MRPAGAHGLSARAASAGSGSVPLQRTERALPIALLRAREAVMARFRPVLAEHGITEQQWRVVRVLDENGPLDATELSARCCILLPSLTRMMRALEERRLIHRERDCDDGRRLTVAIAAAGRALVDEVAPESASVYAGLEAEFGKAEMERLLDLLERLQAIG